MVDYLKTISEVFKAIQNFLTSNFSYRFKNVSNFCLSYLSHYEEFDKFTCILMPRKMLSKVPEIS